MIDIRSLHVKNQSFGSFFTKPKAYHRHNMNTEANLTKVAFRSTLRLTTKDSVWKKYITNVTFKHHKINCNTYLCNLCYAHNYVTLML